MRLIKIYLYSLAGVLVLAMLVILAIKLGWFEKDEPAYFLNVNLTPTQRQNYESEKAAELARLKEFPNTFEAYLNLGNIERELGKASQAIAYFKKAYEIIPTNNVPLNNIGRIYLSLQLYPEAEAAFLKAKSILPEDWLSYLNLVDLYQVWPEKQGEIRGVYLQALAATDNSDQIMIPFAAYLWESKNFSEALLYYQELAKRFPERPDFLEMIKEIQAALNSSS